MKNYIILLIWLCWSSALFAQDNPNITGPITTCPNKGYTYTWSDDQPYTSLSWTVSGGGTIVSGTGTSRVIKFSSDGQIRVNAYYNGNHYYYENVTVFNPGTVSISQSNVCYGATVSLSSSGMNAGPSNQYTWQILPAGQSTWQNLGTGMPYYHTVTGSAQFRLVAGGCLAIPSNTVSVGVYPGFSAGSIGSSQTICYNTTPSVLTNASSPSGGSGSYSYQWQSSPNNSTWSNISGATGSTYQPGALTSSTYFRRAASSCGTLYTGSVLITVLPPVSGGSAGSNQSICPNTSVTISNNTSPSGGNGSFTYKWQQAPPGGSWSYITGATGLSYTTPNLTSTTQYRRVEGTSCGTTYTSPVTITVYPGISAGTIEGTQSVCYNSSVTLNNTGLASGGSGTINYLWQSSPNGTSWTDISGATGSSYSTPNLTATTHFRRRAYNGCGTAYTSAVVVSVYSNLVGGAAGTSQSICYNTSVALTSTAAASGGTGTISYHWQSSTDGVAWTNITGTNLLSYTTPNLTSTIRYRRAATNSCGTAFTTPVIITVYPNVLAGVAGSAQTICYNTAATLSSTSAASGGNGSFTYQWQSSPNGTTWTNISGATSLSYTTPSLTTTTQYRRQANTSCSTVYTSPAVVTVYNNVLPGAAGTSLSICYNTSTTLNNTSSASGGNGSFTYQWQSSPDGTAWTDISGATSVGYTTPSLTTTTQYRRKATTACKTVFTTPVVITVYSNVTPGSAGSSQSICYNTSAVLSNSSLATGGNGTFNYQWQSSPNGSTWSSITGATNTSYTTPNLTTTTHYRRMVGTSCGTVYTTPVIVTVYANVSAGVAGSSQSVCYNTPATLSSSSTASGGNGSFTYQWQSSPTGTTWSNISGATSTSYTTPSLVTATQYRRRATTGCSTVYSTPAVVSVYNDVLPGAAGASQSICHNTSIALTSTSPATGGNGSFSYQWQSSPNGTTWTDISAATAVSYTTPQLTATTQYKRKATTGCKTVYTSPVTITVYPAVTAGAAGTSQTVCYNVSVALNSSSAAGGGNGTYNYQWQSSPNGTTWSNISGATATAYTTPNLTATTHYRRMVGTGCETAYTTPVIITVNPNVLAGAAGTSQSICYNTAAILSSSSAASGGNGSFTYQWESSPNGTTWSSIAGATTVSYTTPSLTTTTQYRRKASTTCATVYTSPVTVTVYANVTAGARAVAKVYATTPLLHLPAQAGPAVGTGHTRTNGKALRTEVPGAIYREPQVFLIPLRSLLLPPGTGGG